MSKHFAFLIGLILLIGTTSTNRSLKNDEYFEITKNLRIWSDIYDKINELYVDKPAPGELMKVGIDAMLRSLDPYTVYIPESNIEDYRFMTTGQYGGIGAMIRSREGYITITEPYEGFPAQKAGLMAGDIILEVDGASVKDKTTEEMSALLKGGAGTKLDIVYKRNGEKKSLQLKREVVKIPDVPYSGMLTDKIGYIKLNSFTSEASGEVGKALKNLKDNKGMKSLIFDLRGNGGGLLNESVKIVNFFIAQGKEVVSTKGRIEKMNYTYYTLEPAFDENMKVVVLIDENSASASEIVSGSLQDLDRAVIIGQTSYGKGLVQQTKDIQFGSKVKLTVAKYYTPSGRCIQKLDYAHRDDFGDVHEVADSLLRVFKTKNGRIVKDGRGIEPDVKIELPDYSKLTAVLMRNDFVFDYATSFRSKVDSISKPQNYSLDAKEYDLFKSYVSDKDIVYTTDCEDGLKRLIKIAESEKYYEGAKSEFDALFSRLKPSLSSDLERYSDEIKELLENEIVSRYYYQNGRIIHSLNNDPFVKEAISVLNNEESYFKILKGE